MAKIVDPYSGSKLPLIGAFVRLILVWHLPIGKTESTDNRIKMVARHYAIEFKWITFRHRWCLRGPPVSITLNFNPACHVQPTTNPLYILLKTH